MDVEAKNKQFLTPAEVVERYHSNISVRTLANWRSAGQGPAFSKIGGAVLYPISRLIEWEDMNTVTSTSQYRGNAAKVISK